MRSAPLSQSRYWWCHALAGVALPRAYAPDVYTAKCPRLFEHVATGLYYYWTGNHGIVDDAAREDIRRSIVEKVRATFHSGSELAKVLTPRQPYMIGRLITQTGADRSTEAFDAWKDYLPHLLLDGARTHPEALVPEIANLAGDEQSGIVAAGDDYPPIFINRYTIERGRMTAFFGDRLDEVLNVLASYQGNDPYAVRARGAAKDWLDERRGGSPTESQPRTGSGDGNVSPH